ncbi:MAG: PTS sugar transporter subunit IIA, partial [Bacilli bacterium]
ILLHICASLIRNNTLAPRVNVMIVCAGSMATGQYLQAQLKNYFDFNIKCVIKADMVEEVLLKDSSIDLIITSIPLTSIPKPLVQVNALLNMDDLNNIQKTLFNLSTSFNCSQKLITNEIMQELNYVKENSEEFVLSQQLLLELSTLFRKYKKQSSKHKNVALHQILKPKYIKYVKEIKTWQDAMHQSASILQSYGYIKETYIKQAIENVIKYGDYIIISDEIALAHASKDAGVLKNGLSLLVIKDRVIFQEGKVVRLLFTFACSDDIDYNTLFKEIIDLGHDKNLLAQITSTNNIIDIYYQLLR